MLTTDREIVKAKIKVHQTVIDYSCQNAGTMESLFEVAELNGVSITQDVATGTELLAPKVDLKVIGFYKGSVMDINTNQSVQPVQGGIGYMQIGTSFKVS